MNHEYTQHHEQEPVDNWTNIEAGKPVELALDHTDGEQYVKIFAGNEHDATDAEEDDLRHFTIVDTRTNKLFDGHHIHESVDYILVQNATYGTDKKGYMGLRKGDFVPVGRKVRDTKLNERMDLSENTMSRDHFTIAVDHEGNLMIGDNGSSNGTQYELKSAAQRHETDGSAESGVESMSPQERERLERVFKLAEPFDVNSPEAQPDRFGNRRDQRARTTEESLAQAEVAMQSADDSVREIIMNKLVALREQGVDLREVSRTELIRTDHELRADLLDHLLTKLDDPEGKLRLPSRFYGSSSKNPNHSGYGTMSSREYAGLLALSMLDGTFKGRASDPIEVSLYGDASVGQHRYGAMLALFTNKDGYDGGNIKRYAGDQIKQV